MNRLFDQFKNVVVYDYEYKFTPGNPPEPVCVVYKELHTGQITKNWLIGEDQFTCAAFVWYLLDVI